MRSTVAEWLSKHPKVAWVSYPGLPSDKNHAHAEEIFAARRRRGLHLRPQGRLSRPASSWSKSVELFSHLANVGDTKSLIIHPASTTHRQLSDEQKVAAGAGPDVVRLSVGIEDVEDIIADLEQAPRQGLKATGRA